MAIFNSYVKLPRVTNMKNHHPLHSMDGVINPCWHQKWDGKTRQRRIKNNSSIRDVSIPRKRYSAFEWNFQFLSLNNIFEKILDKILVFFLCKPVFYWLATESIAPSTIIPSSHLFRLRRFARRSVLPVWQFEAPNHPIFLRDSIVKTW